MHRHLVKSYCKVSVNDVFSDQNRQRTIQALNKLKPLATIKRVEDVKVRAGVLVPLCTVNGERSLLFTMRSMKLRSNRGQVAFPGGIYDSTDETLENTAIRETYEEIGIPRDQIDVWGPGPSVGRWDMMVYPTVANVGEIDPACLRINPDEVESAFAVSLVDMCDPKYFGTTSFKNKNFSYRLPVFVTQTFKMWGLTALITHAVLQCLMPQQYRNRVQLQLLSSHSLPSMKKQCKA